MIYPLVQERFFKLGLGLVAFLFAISLSSGISQASAVDQYVEFVPSPGVEKPIQQTANQPSGADPTGSSASVVNPDEGVNLGPSQGPGDRGGPGEGREASGGPVPSFEFTKLELANHPEGFIVILAALMALTGVFGITAFAVRRSTESRAK